MTGLVIAVDGGQSSSLALAAERSGRIVGVGRAGASNHIHEPGGVERLTAALEGTITGALGAYPRGNVSHACLGLSGGPTIAREIAARFLPNSEIVVFKDIVTALAGANAGADSGVIVIAGTGAVAYGRLEDGQTALADGWGYWMGDEGSAYDIGMMALKAAARASDARGPYTLLLERIPAHFELTDLRAVHRQLYSHRISRPQIASLAALVSATARDDDPASRDILVAAGKSLGKSALAVIKRLDRLERGLSVYYIGGVFRAGEFVLSSFRGLIAEHSPHSLVQVARYTPVIGGLLLALRAAGVEITDGVFANIEATMPPEAHRKDSTDE